jgi:hypothetical protein
MIRIQQGRNECNQPPSQLIDEAVTVAKAKQAVSSGREGDQSRCGIWKAIRRERRGTLLG